MSSSIKLFLCGALSPLLGFFVYFLQMHMNPSSPAAYAAVQILMLLLYLFAIYVVGWHFGRKNYTRQNGVYFFIVPFILLFFNHVMPLPISNANIRVAMMGMEAPFHLILSHMHFSFDPGMLIPIFLPTIVCLFVFHLGEYLALEKYSKRRL